MKRRTFLKIAGIGSLSIAAGCSPDAEKHLYTLVNAPDDMVTGKAAWYATTCRECPAGCGVIAKNREGRVIKLEGNPLSPINQGALCMRGQAALQAVYHPDRLTTPMVKKGEKWQPVTTEEAVGMIRSKGAAAAAKGRDRVKLMTEVAGESFMATAAAVLKTWHSGKPIVFEPVAYESLKAANRDIFQVDGLPSYRIDASDCLVSFGADFLDTWLSPVEYTRKFKEMHRFAQGRKARFFHISACRTLTGANADHWLACRPGSEVAIALGLLRHAVAAGKGRELPPVIYQRIQQVSERYDDAAVQAATGISARDFTRLKDCLMAATAPLILGTGPAVANSVQTDMAANLLNLILDPTLRLIDMEHRHRVEIAASRGDIAAFFQSLKSGDADLVLLNNVNPVYALPKGSQARVLQSPAFFTVCFSAFMDETAALADLVIPVRLPLESWDDYSGRDGVTGTLQPAMGALTDAPHLVEILLDSSVPGPRHDTRAREWLYAQMLRKGSVSSEMDWLDVIQTGGRFDAPGAPVARDTPPVPAASFADLFHRIVDVPASDLAFTAVPSLRFFDGRNANRPWLCEVPDPITSTAWQNPVVIHPDTAAKLGIAQGDMVRIQSKWGRVGAPVYESADVVPGLLAMHMGQGRTAGGRWAEGVGTNPLDVLPSERQHVSDGPLLMVTPVTILSTGEKGALAHTDGSREQHDRKIALSVAVADLIDPPAAEPAGLTMDNFPLTLPIAEGYDPKRDFYPPHDHEGYRWGMVVDLDRCVGCGACAVACYAENNIGIAGEDQIRRGREMAWMRIERYVAPADGNRISFLPMMCQHCDNAPCESVCPVYAPHHSKEGLNNQIYNRCIGTRFCAQNCPYKVRRFNWYTWQWPKPMNLQLNPNVTVRSKGVMEKCSFCIQRIKEAHGTAKNEARAIADGEVVPACVQTCPTGALTFGSFMDPESRIRQLAADPRAYQVMGYLNTKPAVIYLKKVVHDL
ncbi:MAG: 4Fe-4S dicluster domain-containing protein [Pseudomonadota bacterium]